MTAGDGERGEGKVVELRWKRGLSTEGLDVGCEEPGVDERVLLRMADAEL